MRFTEFMLVSSLELYNVPIGSNVTDNGNTKPTLLSFVKRS